MKNGRVIEGSPKYTMKREGKSRELLINAAELSDSGDCTAMVGRDPNEQCSSASVTVAETFAIMKSVCVCLCDVHALIGDPAQCYRVGDGVCCNGGCFLPQSSWQIKDMKRIWIVKQGVICKLITDRMGEECEGRWTFYSPVIEESVLELFAAHSVTVKTTTASIKVPFKAKPMPKVTWFKDGIEVAEEEKVLMEKTSDCITSKPENSLWLSF
ncbi:unnamed protein product [Bubo scandiacus]